MLIATLLLVFRKMDKSYRDAFIQSIWFRYLLRIILLYIFSVVFRSFDLSFKNATQAAMFREQSFSIMFVAIGLIVWQTAALLSQNVQRYLAQYKTSTIIITLIAVLSLHGLTASIAFGLCYAALDAILFNRYEAWQSISNLSYDLILGIFIFYLLILGGNAILYYYKSWQEARLNAEKLRRENIQARYDVLKSQIDPHFFFNSLSVLSNIVYRDAQMASEYILQLSKCYRYILDKKMESLVSMESELTFLQSYIYLIQIRHGECIYFDIRLDETIIDKTTIAPAALQMLVENAVKHNRFSLQNPLRVSIYNDHKSIVVSNELHKQSSVSSTGIGLDNIKKRYELVTDKRVTVNDADGMFVVTLPIIYNHRK